MDAPFSSHKQQTPDPGRIPDIPPRPLRFCQRRSGPQRGSCAKKPLRKRYPGSHTGPRHHRFRATFFFDIRRIRRWWPFWPARSAWRWALKIGRHPRPTLMPTILKGRRGGTTPPPCYCPPFTGQSGPCFPPPLGCSGSCQPERGTKGEFPSTYRQGIDTPEHPMPPTLGPISPDRSALANTRRSIPRAKIIPGTP